MKCKVSVLMPVYNGLPLIKASLESLRKQTYKNWECIIVDDGSTDGTSAFLDSIGEENIKVYHLQSNQGRPAARQKTLEMASGEYIAILDAGDLYHPEKLKLQVEAIERDPGIDLVGSRMCSFGTETDKLYVRGNVELHGKAYDGKDLPCHGTCLMKTSIAKSIRYNPKLKLGEDADFLEKYLSGGRKYVVLTDVLYYYSELDSVSKDKIIKSYYIYMKHFFEQGNRKKMVEFLLKYCYSKLLFPFYNLDAILASRGETADENTRRVFLNCCKPLVESSIQ